MSTPTDDLGPGAWSWDYDGYEPDEEGRREALCATGNGYLTTRAAHPWCSADDVHYPGTYAAGVYNRRSAQVDSATITNESLVNLPNWLPLTVRIDDGPWFDLDDASHWRLQEYRQSLDLRRGVLLRRLRVADDEGRGLELTQRQLASQHDPHVAAMDVTVRACDWAGRLGIRSGIDAGVRNTLVERYSDLPSQHLDVLHTGHHGDDSVLVEVATNQSGIRIAMAARTRLRRGDETLPDERSEAHDGQWVGHEMSVPVQDGETVTVEKVVTVCTSRDNAISEPVEEAVRWLERSAGMDQLLADHTLAWAHLWEHGRLEMPKPSSLRVLRLHLLHLLQTVSPNTTDLDVGVPPRGLTGEAYRGHILWDELFMVPVLTLRLPALTRALVMYRYRRLPEARHAARAAGYRGAMFPWQSGSDGREESQQLHLNPESGRWLPDPTQRQRHVGLAIAYNVWQYYEATGDREFLVDVGAELILEVALFFADLAEYDASRARYVIRGVMGPDEFHSGYPDAEDAGIDNNAYTNVMTVWLLLRAHDVLDLLPSRSRRQLDETLGLSRHDLIRWQEITRRMYVPFHDGVISQFEGYERLDELDWTRYRERYESIQRLDRILEAEGDDVNRYQASKQADALMLFYLFSAEELDGLLSRLGYEMAPDTIPRTIDYYLARTSHGSTLSAVVHSWVLARSHRDQAVDLFSRALESDVEDIQGGTTPEGVHLAAMAGSVDLLVRCFSGVEARGEKLVFNPYWPPSFGELTFGMRYRAHDLSVTVSGQGVDVRSEPGRQEPVQVQCREESAVLAPGATVSFSSRGAGSRRAG